jgi:MFS family permease
LLGTLIGGWLADTLQRRFPQGRMLVATLAFLIGAPLTLIALSLHDITLFVIFFAFAIICLSQCLGPLNAIIQDIISPEMRATGVGLILLLAHLFGDVTSTAVIGIIADHLTLSTTLRIITPTCLFIAGLVCLIGTRTIAKDMQAMQTALESQQAAEIAAPQERDE